MDDDWPLRRLLGLAGNHAEGLQVQLQHRLFFFTLVGVFFAEADDLAQNLGVKAVALGFGVNFLDVGRYGFLFLFQALYAFNNALQLPLGEA